MPYVDVRLCLILLLVVNLNGGLINLALVPPSPLASIHILLSQFLARCLGLSAVDQWHKDRIVFDNGIQSRDPNIKPQTETRCSVLLPFPTIGSSRVRHMFERILKFAFLQLQAGNTWRSVFFMSLVCFQVFAGISLKTDHCNEGILHFTFVLQSFRVIVAVLRVIFRFLLNRE